MVRLRGGDAGGAKRGRRLYVNDPTIRFQLQDPRYCGGHGLLGELCPSLPPLKSRLVVRDYRSFTLRVSNQERSQEFYQSLFGMAIKGRQGTVPMLGAGSGSQRLLIDTVETAGAPPRTTHACLVMDAFDPDKILKARGVSKSGSGPPAGPLSLRGRDLPFTDPTAF